MNLYLFLPTDSPTLHFLIKRLSDDDYRRPYMAVTQESATNAVAFLKFLRFKFRLFGPNFSGRKIFQPKQNCKGQLQIAKIELAFLQFPRFRKIRKICHPKHFRCSDQTSVAEKSYRTAGGSCKLQRLKFTNRYKFQFHNGVPPIFFNLASFR